MVHRNTYEKYKDSGVEWIGRIPDDWTMINLRYLCDIDTGSRDTQDTVEDGLYPFFVRSQTLERLDDYTHDEEAVMTAGDGVGVGKVFHYFRGKFSAHQRVYIFSKFRLCRGRFIFYYLKSNLAYEVLKSNAKSTVDSLRRPMLTNFPVSVPPIQHQDEIIKFLDQSIVDIDSIISDKERLIVMLENQRQGVITESLTRGLNPLVKMKESGLEWIAEVPEHWQVLKIKHVVAQIEYGISESSKGVGEYKLLTMGNIHDGEIQIPVDGSLNELDERYLLNANDLLFNRTNSLDQIAKVGIFRGSIEDKVTFASYLVRLKVNEKADSEFLNLLLNCHPFLSYARSFAIPSVSQANLNANRYTNLKIILPPVDEQRAIRDRIVERSQHISDAIDEINQQIHKLKEYRMSLIFEAVTGKIDVRYVTVEATMMA